MDEPRGSPRWLAAGDRTHPHDALLFPCVAIAFGITIQYLSSRFRFFRIVPFTVWLFIIGVFIGMAHKESQGKLGTLSISIDMWKDIDPHLVLYAFLPLLLFGDSMSIKWHDFKGCLAQCSFLAGPGVLMGTLIMFLVMKYVFPYDWTVSETAAFASTLAATDPVAVVGVLKELGASRTLTMQIAGESLLNDGVAIVIWTIFFESMQGKETTGAAIVGKFFRLGFGGVAWGLFCGYLALQGIHLASDKFIHSDQLVQLSLTILIAYLSFFIGENEFGVSGVLSTIFTAIVLAKDAWPIICCWEAVDHVWHCLEFFGNTILFLLCGTVWALGCYNVQWVDFGWLLVLYVISILARTFMLFSAYPFLNWLAPSKVAQVSWKECLVMSWGGLRGAVGLALALSMKTEMDIQNKTDRGDLMVFLVGGFAGLTLIINATTCGPLLEMLGMIKASSHELLLVRSLQEKLYAESLDDLRFKCENEPLWAGVDKDAVENLLTIVQKGHGVEEDMRNTLGSEEMEKTRTIAIGHAYIPTKVTVPKIPTVHGLYDSEQNSSNTFGKSEPNHWWWGHSDLQARIASVGADVGDLDKYDMKMERKMYLSMVRAEYFLQLRSDMIPEHAEGARDLFTSIDKAEDLCFDGLSDWKMLAGEMVNKYNSVMEFLQRFKVSPYRSYVSKKTEEGGLCDLFTAVIFLDVHHIVGHRLLSESKRIDKTRLKVLEESCSQMEVAHKWMQDNKVGPVEIGEVRTKQLASLIFAKQKRQVAKWQQRGIISEREAEELLHPVHRGVHRIETGRFNCSGVEKANSMDPPRKFEEKASLIQLAPEPRNKKTSPKIDKE